MSARSRKLISERARSIENLKAIEKQLDSMTNFQNNQSKVKHNFNLSFLSNTQSDMPSNVSTVRNKVAPIIFERPITSYEIKKASATKSDAIPRNH